MCVYAIMKSKDFCDDDGSGGYREYNTSEEYLTKILDDVYERRKLSGGNICSSLCLGDVDDIIMALYRNGNVIFGV